MAGNLVFSRPIVVLVLLSLVEGIASADECTSYMTLPDIRKRSTDFIYDGSTPALSDNNGFVEGWYRAGYYDMSNNNRENNRCGTIYPFYLRDPIPNDDEILESRACYGDTHDPCVTYKDIKVRNCTAYGFRVYYLVRLGFQSAAYCFDYIGWNEVPSQKVHKAEAKYRNLIWESDTSIGVPRIMFECDFTPLADKSLYYAVTWKVDNHTKVGETKVVNSSSLDQAYLNEKELTNAGFRHGINLFCEVVIRFHPNGTSGQVTTGTPFYAGIKTPRQSMTINEGQKVNVALELTVPFACNSDYANCELPVQMLNPGDLGVCDSSLIVTDSDRCRALFTGRNEANAGTFYSSNEWKTQSLLPMQQSHVDTFEEYPYFTLALTTGEVNHLFWSEKRLPSMTINVNYKQRNWRGRQCHAVADPHVCSFDDMYFEQHNPGIYIFYRNGKQEVHYKTQPCFSGIVGAYCVCGVAVRAGRDVFVIDICNGENVLGFHMCEDSTLTVKSDKSSRYEITFPTGTEVHLNVQFNWGYINLYIYPSAKDEHNSAGLCGNLDGNCNNDLRKRDGTIVPMTTNCKDQWKHPDEFTNSWKVTGDESFFDVHSEALNTLESWDSTAVFCRCSTATINDSTKPPIIPDVSDCSTREFNKCEESPRFKDFRCYIKPLKRRKRRDLTSRRQRSFERDAENILPSENERQRRSIDVNMPAEEARLNCETVFNQSEIVRICKDNVEQIGDSYLENCILDLQMTGDVSLAELALQLLKDACNVFVRKNVTLLNESPGIVTVIYNSTCPGNCSSNGYCVKGECICDDEYTGTDCSKDVSKPPTISDIDDSGICDKAEDTCDDIFIYGENFLDADLTSCRFETKLTLIDGSVIDDGISILNGTQRSVFEAICIPPDVTNSSVLNSMHRVSVSNDGMAYSNSMELFIYDSTCQKMKNDSGVVSITLKDNYCFIERKCVTRGMLNPVDSCMKCDPTKYIASWSSISGCETLPDVSVSYSSLVSDTSATASSLSSTSKGTIPPSHIVSSSTTSGSQSTPKSGYPRHRSEDNTNINVMYIVLPLVVLCVGLIIGVIIVKVKINSTRARANKIPEKEYGSHPGNQYSQKRTGSALSSLGILSEPGTNNKNMHFNSSAPAVSHEIFNHSRPASSQTTSLEFLDRDTSKGPNLSMFLAKK